MIGPPTESALESTARALIESAPDAVVTVDTTGSIVLVNDEAERVFGYSREELIGSSVDMLLPERARERHVSHREQYNAAPVRRPMGSDLELLGRRKDGTEFPVEISLSPVNTASGMLITSIIRDVTERKKAEQELRRWAEYFERSGQGLAILAGDGTRRLVVNPAYARMHGYTQAELNDSAVGNLIHPDYRQALVEHLARADAEGHHTFETVHYRKDRSTFPISMDVTTIKDDAGVMLYRIVHAFDVTDRVRAEEELKQTADELARSNAELQQFAYVASHDLQEPLRMVASYTQLLARRYRNKLGEDADEFIGFAVEGAQRMQTLINDLLELSRVGTRAAELGPTSLDEVLQEVLTDLSAAISESGALITFDTLPVVLGDRTQLRQLFQNLVSNAMKFHGEKPSEVHVGVSDHGSDWLITVRDNGIGIEGRHADRIFVIFQRLHTREEYAGTGIGLAICKKIVERHGGTIWVESQPGLGSSFHFTIPKIRGVA